VTGQLVEDFGNDPKAFTCDRCKQPIGANRPFVSAMVYRQSNEWTPEAGYANEVYLESVLVHLDHMIGTGGVHIPYPAPYDPRIDGPRG
jgi:hypothetical protein